jgi:hypothetical protein
MKLVFDDQALADLERIFEWVKRAGEGGVIYPFSVSLNE